MIEFVRGEPTHPYAYPVSVIESGLALGGVGIDANGNYALCICHDALQYARLDAIDQAARRLVELAEPDGVVSVGRIGHPLPWSEVRLVLQRVCERSRTVTVRVYEWGT